jgi:hypothetical protein
MENAKNDEFRLRSFYIYFCNARIFLHIRYISTLKTWVNQEILWVSGPHSKISTSQSQVWVLQQFRLKELDRVSHRVLFYVLNFYDDKANFLSILNFCLHKLSLTSRAENCTNVKMKNYLLFTDNMIELAFDFKIKNDIFFVDGISEFLWLMMDDLCFFIISNQQKKITKIMFFVVFQYFAKGIKKFKI